MGREQLLEGMPCCWLGKANNLWLLTNLGSSSADTSTIPRLHHFQGPHLTTDTWMHRSGYRTWFRARQQTPFPAELVHQLTEALICMHWSFISSSGQYCCIPFLCTNADPFQGIWDLKLLPQWKILSKLHKTEGVYWESWSIRFSKNKKKSSRTHDPISTSVITVPMYLAHAWDLIR